MPVTITGTRRPVLGGDVVESDGLSFEDHLTLMRAGVSEKWTNYAVRRALPILRESTITVKTIERTGRDEEIDYVHTKPVIKNNPNPTQWVTPRGRLIFEPNFEGLRHGYHSRQYKPAELTITFEGRMRPYTWTLTPETDSAPYEFVGNHFSSLIPPTMNTMTFGPRDRFTIFNYVHEDDPNRQYSARIFYKIDENWMRLHCVSIPLKLFPLLVSDYRDNRRHED